MSLRERIRKLEHVLADHMHIVPLQGGRSATIPDEDLLDCLVAAMEGAEHPLLATVRMIAATAAPDKLVDLIRQFDSEDHREFMAGMKGGAGSDAVHSNC